MTDPSFVPAIEESRTAFGVPGVSWAVIDGGEIALQGQLGVQTSGDPTPVSGRTRFQACSISKPIAALAMLRLVDRGLLDLDEDVNAKLTSWRLPRNADWQPVVTLRHLTSHSAGLTTSGFPGYKRTDRLPTTVQILNGVDPANTFGVRVDAVPGTQFRYSGGGTLTMQLLLEDVTRTPFADLMRELVLDPLAMTDSDYTQPAPKDVHDVLATAHNKRGQPVEGGWHVYPEQATAGLWTTPVDLCKYAQAVRAAYAGEAGALVSRPLAAEMLTPQVVASDRIGGLNALGLGPFLTTDGAPRFGHSGGNEGFRCHLLAYRDEGLGAAVMTNSDNGGWVVQRAYVAIAAAQGWPDYPTDVDEPDLPNDDELAAVAGTYRSKAAFEFTVETADTALRVTFAGQAPMDFSPLGHTKDGAIEFGANETDTTLRLANGELTFVQNDQELSCDKL